MADDDLAGRALPDAGLLLLRALFLDLLLIFFVVHVPGLPDFAPHWLPCGLVRRKRPSLGSAGLILLLGDRLFSDGSLVALVRSLKDELLRRYRLCLIMCLPDGRGRGLHRSGHQTLAGASEA